ncbi:MAG: 23S rRNA (pseudouridine1915-N3)-methyltransferase [Rhodobacteraceae bacterium HLUCCO07]|nr:MAG: 23S rRNA (pseudouridine1915-N3)-methyltransferase [Rhodobacteraceae bacterium HLUCCO07]
MRVHLCAVGRLRAGPEKVLVDDYATRFDRTGRALGLGPLTITEIEDRKGAGIEAEATLLMRALPDRARLIALDERGKTMASPAFAATLAGFRDDGASDLALVIGGADGLSAALRDRADLVLSLGSMVWPHMLARVMLAEQLYRAAAILAGTPYHRA